MRIAVLSGKGGTGKLWYRLICRRQQKSTYIDCDVEEPNGHLFFKPVGINEEEVSRSYPRGG